MSGNLRLLGLAPTRPSVGETGGGRDDLTVPALLLVRIQAPPIIQRPGSVQGSPALMRPCPSSIRNFFIASTPGIPQPSSDGALVHGATPPALTRSCPLPEPQSTAVHFISILGALRR
ncbi:hypothetical protein BU24DRAFT_421076 [Aaosphaeria arxii CBS 175.79]|uniref:Uncharacterized protein n=1 Tax=Aaosphaeria arxii CBS 175.79 TaxID=1450172 RepID=A0A6A5XZL7_9PLEO|nr:uncharacterized protein BU24DRAFT_421076 [Aaosphaeria arxii CBS 175.79]KAF2018060.1 hypothetical protein BU24DRAFT_421076 [Aaosphaeria arxii CBS 175.79]